MLPQDDPTPYTKQQKYVWDRLLPYLSEEVQIKWKNLAVEKAPGVQKKRAMLINAHVSKTASYGTRVDSSKVVDHIACTGKTESRAKK